MFINFPFFKSMLQRDTVLVTANVASSSPIFAILLMEATRSSETSVITRATRRNIPEDVILNVFYVKSLNLEKIFYKYYIVRISIRLVQYFLLSMSTR
jgi:hypothetical protein